MSNIRMVKKRPLREHVFKFLDEFPDLLYDGAKVICKVCDKPLMCWDKRDCKHHVNTLEHTNKKNGLPTKTQFMFDLNFMLISCNLPLDLLDQQPFQHFWNKYNPNYKLPSRSTLRRYVPSIREEIENKIKSELKNKQLWLCVDDTIDCKKNSIVNVIVRVLEPLKPTSAILLASKRVENCTSKVITRVVLDALEQFQLSTTQLLMFVTDGAATMRSVGRSLKEECGRFLHITCKIQALHIVTETIREYFPEVDELIENTKKVFLKSPECIQEFQKQCPDIPEPPQLDLTSSGTWLKAVSYYYEYFKEIKSVILKFDPEEDATIKKSHIAFQDASIETDLTIIHDNYKRLLEAIEELQNTTSSLEEAFQILDDVNAQLHTISDTRNDRVKKKFDSIIKNDSDFTTLRQICDGASTDPLINFKDYFKYACITSEDAEQSFLRYKDIFSSQRTSLTETTVETYLMLQMFQKSYPDCDNIEGNNDESDDVAPTS